jgi:hypothetical protein
MKSLSSRLVEEVAADVRPALVAAVRESLASSSEFVVSGKLPQRSSLHENRLCSGEGCLRKPFHFDEYRWQQPGFPFPQRLFLWYCVLHLSESRAGSERTG